MSPLGILFLFIVGVALFAWARRLRTRSGLPTGDVIYADTAQWQRVNRPLFSRQHQLTGKPDYLIRQGDDIIPVEVKSGSAPPRGPYDSHVYQLAAYCQLVADTYGVRPAYGLIQYADQSYTVDYTAGLEAALLDLLDEMRADANSDDVPRSHRSAARCRACGVNEYCDESLA